MEPAIVSALRTSIQNKLDGSSEGGDIVGQDGDAPKFSESIGSSREPLGLVQSSPIHPEQAIGCLSSFFVCACHDDTHACWGREVEATFVWRQERILAFSRKQDAQLREMEIA